jgi:surfeit locus 1 family protein
MMFQGKWLFATLFVLVGTVVCARLGIWQLDRLDQRRVFNAHYEEVVSLEPLALDATFNGDLTAMEYRRVSVTGEYDFSNQIAIRNQYHGDVYGYHVLTPLILADGTAILIDRGWIPPNDDRSAWSEYDQFGSIAISGIIRLSRSEADFGGLSDPPLKESEARSVWNQPNIPEISKQIAYEIKPVYVQLDPEPARETPPFPYQPDVEITEGPHMGYALQWFTFAILLFGGYPFFLKKQV